VFGKYLQPGFTPQLFAAFLTALKPNESQLEVFSRDLMSFPISLKMGLSVAAASGSSLNASRPRSHNLPRNPLAAPAPKLCNGDLGTQSVATIPKRAKAVAVMMTPFREEMADLVEEARVNNAYTCLYKPLDMAEALRLVDEILDRKQQAG